MTTLNTLAKVVNLSPATISRVLNGNPNQRISPAKRRLVVEAARKYGYRPSPAGRSLVTRKTLNVGLVMHYGAAPINIVNPSLLTGMMMSLERTLQENHYGLNVVFISRQDPEGSFKKLLTTHRSFDAVVFPARVASREMIDLATRHGIPSATLLDAQALGWPTNHFHNDEEQDIRCGIDYLVGLGHREIAIFGWDAAGPLAEGTFSKTAYEALLGHGIQTPPEWICCIEPGRDPFYSHRDHGRDALQRLLQSGSRPSAILCRSDFMAYGVMDAMQEAGLRLGRDIALVGHGNIEVVTDCPGYEPILTTFDIPLDALGRAAAEALLGQIKEPERPIQQKLYPSKLIIRHSTEPKPLV